MFARRLAWLLVLAASAPALANDSTAERGAGGLELVETSDVAMRSEDLRISPTSIAIRYVFRNEAASDRTLTVAFPLPPIDAFGVDYRNVDLPVPDTANFVGFTVKVDGRPQSSQVEERAFVGERDVTDLLKRHGLPLNPLSSDLGDAMGKLDDAAWSELETAGVLQPRDAGEGLWRYEAKFHFDMTFPAGRDVVVEHDYMPVSGTQFLVKETLEDEAVRDSLCIDPGTRKAMEKVIARAKAAAAKANPGDPPAAGVGVLVTVPYILTTANNWAGPIGRFHLTVDKGRPENVVSLCRDGIRKTGPTTFEFTATDYVPERDLLVGFAGADIEAVKSE